MDKKLKEIIFTLVSVFGSVLIALVVAELFIHDYKVGFKNLILAEGGDLVRHHFNGLYSYDSLLGWVPASNTKKIKWGTEISTLNDGIRSNGTQNITNNKTLIMAFGDSYTFADEVGDSETRPAYIQELTGSQTLNAGVSSYGLDQTILRAQQLVPKYNPDIIIIGFVYDDMRRCQQSVRHGVPKPYFKVKNNRLVLKNVPIPFKENVQMDLFRRIFGYSQLVHKLMCRLAPQYWWQDTMNDFRYVKGNNALQITALLLHELKKFTDEHRRVILLILDDRGIDETRHLVFRKIIDYVQKHLPQVEICDAASVLFELKKTNPKKFEELYHGAHMSSDGNAMIALMVAKIISKK